MNIISIERDMNAVYDKAISEAKTFHEAVLMKNKDRQYKKFQMLVHNVMVEESSILDLGCGNAELYAYLQDYYHQFTYKGIDINSNLLNQAIKRFPFIDVEEVSILQDNSAISLYDYVLCSGLFNVDVGQGIEYIYDMIRKAFNTCNKAFVFNALSTYVNYQDDGLLYLDPVEILSYCLTLTPRVTLTHGIPEYNYTVYMEKV